VTGPELGDAIGAKLLEELAGRCPPLVIERDDGFISVDLVDYLGPLTERDEWAVSRATGRVLDVGSGPGRGSLALQERGQDVTALDVSPGAIEACRRRAVRSTYLGGISQAVSDGLGKFDSALLLGNNLGLLGSRAAAPRFLADLAALLRPGGVIAGTAAAPPPQFSEQRVHLNYQDQNRRAGRLPGAWRIRSRYKQLATDWYDWLILTPAELADLARPAGWEITELREGPGSLYAVVLTRF
jgi:SAM-dependent methyltransferase